jgi:hypothetical protein
MSKEQFDLFSMPPANLARAHSSEQVTNHEWTPPRDGHPLYLAAQEMIHFTAYLKLTEWQQKHLWPHLESLLDRMRKAESDHVRWFELGYIISAMEIEQLRSRSAASAICLKYGVKIND